MNDRGRKYKPFDKGDGLQKELIKRVALKAGLLLPNYTFKSHSAPPLGIDSLLSDELQARSSAKFESFETVVSKWTDRHSIIAAPLGAEIYLQDERCSTILGSPQFYHDRLNTLHDAEGTKAVLDAARVRFKYSDEAHAAAKVVAGRFVKILRIRNRAAAVLQVCPPLPLLPSSLATPSLTLFSSHSSHSSHFPLFHPLAPAHAPAQVPQLRQPQEVSHRGPASAPGRQADTGGRTGIHTYTNTYTRDRQACITMLHS